MLEQVNRQPHYLTTMSSSVPDERHEDEAAVGCLLCFGPVFPYCAHSSFLKWECIFYAIACVVTLFSDLQWHATKELPKF